MTLFALALAAPIADAAPPRANARQELRELDRSLDTLGDLITIDGDHVVILGGMVDIEGDHVDILHGLVVVEGDHVDILSGLVVVDDDTVRVAGISVAR